MLKLTPKDNLIYEEFRKEFPDFSVGKLDEEALKSPAAKEVSHGKIVSLPSLVKISFFNGVSFQH